MNAKSLAVAAILGLSAASLAPAATIVDWTYGSNGTFAGWTVQNEVVGTAHNSYRNYNTTTALGHFTNSKDSSTVNFYGGVWATNDGWGKCLTFETGIDQQAFGAKSYGVYLFDKAGFLNGGSAATVSFDATTTLYRNAQNDVVGAQWAIQDGGQIYVSATAAANGSNDTNLNAKQWYLYNPSGSDYNTLKLDTTGSTVGHTFTNVQAIGLYVGISTNDYYVNNWNKMTVSNAVVPEPALMGLLAVSGSSLLMLRRRRQA